MKLTCMRGLPGAGKSTRAHEIAADTGAVIISRDELRREILGRDWAPNTDEDTVSQTEGVLVVELLTSGRSVIVDNVHLNPQHLRDWADTAALLGAEFEVVEVPTPIETCVMRDRERIRRGKRGVGELEIRRQATQWCS